MTLKTSGRILGAALLAAGMSVTSLPAAAQSDDQQAVLRQASVYMSTITHAQGDFVQVAPGGERTTGKFYISRPGKLRFDYASPSTLQLIADGRTVAVRDRRLNTQDIYPLGQTPLRYLLSNSINLANDAKVIAVYPEGEGQTIVLEDSTPAGTGRLALHFDERFELRQWTVTDPQGQETRVQLQNVTFGQEVDPGTFRIRMERPGME